MNTRLRIRSLLTLTTVAAVLLTGLPLAGATAAPSSGPTIEVASGKPELVTGGDVLLEVTPAEGADPKSVKVAANGNDVTARFALDKPRGVLVGLVKELPEGNSTITATSSGASTSLEITNSPRPGPLFAGPKQTPFLCQTDVYKVPVVGGSLGKPLNSNCSVYTRRDYIYRTTSLEWKVWPKGAKKYPADMGRTTTSTGKKVPFVVRLEAGTINRGIYQFAVLHDPIAEPTPTPTLRPKGWNGRLVYAFGGGCAGGWYKQGSTTANTFDPVLLSKGYAVASNSLNVFRNNCNDVLAAETATMTKEVFIEKYGRDEHTIGFGCSGGSDQAFQIADNYPGVLDGIIVGCSFPEVTVGTVNFITDAWLLKNYFEKSASVPWTAEQKRAVTGFANLKTMDAVAGTANRIDPRRNCDMVDANDRYDPAKNPGGVRCDIYTNSVNVYGTDPATGFARRPLDNVGIQYGLEALRSGAMTTAQFLDLNEAVGGFDDDANIVDARTKADPEAVKTAYKTGRVVSGGLGLATTPIIDYRAYLDDKAAGDIHVRYQTFSMRERLVKANGDAANHVSLLEDARYGLFNTRSPLLRYALNNMDAWLTAIDADTDEQPSREAMLSAKPSGLSDRCMTRDAKPTTLVMPLNRDPASKCEQLYPSASFPREVAGESVSADAIVCSVRTPVRSDYPAMSDADWMRLTEVFDDGVCDYAVPGQFSTPLLVGHRAQLDALPIAELRIEGATR